MANPNDWRLKKKQGPISGDLLDGCQIRRNDDGTIDFLAVVATTSGEGPTWQFPQFAYQGLIWNIGINTFNYMDRNEVEGNWFNNLAKTPGEEDGTYTGQAGSGGGQEEECGEDAASASA